jgi:Xaa-Pro dipeptidase
MGLEVHDVGEAPFPAGPAYSLYGFKSPPQDWTEAFLQLLQPSATSNQFLEPGHVLTVEPGIYFNRYAMEEVYLKDTRFAKYINQPLLERYYPVGGVRIEDDILVTKNGYENLTTAPKGDAALKIINEWKGKNQDVSTMW